MYKDRGIIKWLPFDALTGFRESIDNLIINRGMVSKPVLLEDQIALLNYRLEEAIYQNRQISLIYFERGFLKEISGFVNKISLLDKTLKIDNNEILLTDCLEITFI